jgi:hypothetical protein
MITWSSRAHGEGDYSHGEGGRTRWPSISRLAAASSAPSARRVWAVCGESSSSLDGMAIPLFPQHHNLHLLVHSSSPTGVAAAAFSLEEERPSPTHLQPRDPAVLPLSTSNLHALSSNCSRSSPRSPPPTAHFSLPHAVKWFLIFKVSHCDFLNWWCSLATFYRHMPPHGQGGWQS